MMYNPKDKQEKLPGEPGSVEQEGRITSPELVGKTFVVKDYEERTGSYGRFLLVSVEVDGEQRVWATGSSPVMEALYSHELPALCSLEEHFSRANRRYYTLAVSE